MNVYPANKNFIWITTQFEGFHKYPEAPDEVSFLRDTHRHIFHVKVYIQVFHDDRDIEFFMFKKFVNTLIKESELDYKSCEMISDEIQYQISNKYKGRDIIIEVSEDNENGSRIEYKVRRKY